MEDPTTPPSAPPPQADSVVQPSPDTAGTEDAPRSAETAASAAAGDIAQGSVGDASEVPAEDAAADGNAAGSDETDATEGADGSSQAEGAGNGSSAATTQAVRDLLGPDPKMVGADGAAGAANAPGEERHAIVWVPGLRRGPNADTIEAVAHRVSLALNNHDGKASYSAATGETVVEEGNTTRKATVSRKDAAGEKKVVDIYEFDYRGPLVDGFAKRSPLSQAWQIFATMAANSGNFIAAVKRPGQSVVQKLQVLYAGVLMSVMLLYLLMLLVTGAATAKQGIIRVTVGDSATAVQSDSIRSENRRAAEQRKRQQADSVKTRRQQLAVSQAARQRLADSARVANARPDTRGEALLKDVGTAAGAFLKPVGLFLRTGGEVIWAVLAWIWGGIAAAGLWIWSAVVALGDGVAWLWKAANEYLRELQAGVVTITVLGMVFRFNLKDALARVSGTTTCVGNYLAYGLGRPEIVGRMARLLEHLRDDPRVKYTSVHVVGYSFGSVVAIDCIYQDSEVSAAFNDVTTLATIGCPADFIRTYWRDYFVKRHAPTTEVRWLNVYAPTDVLASNFRDGDFCGYGADDGVGHPGDDKAVGIALYRKAAVPCSKTRTEVEALAAAAEVAAAAGTAEPRKKWKILRGWKLLEATVPAKADADDIVPDAHIFFGPQAPNGLFGWTWFILAGGGFRAHRCYWQDGITTAKTCWEPLVKRMCEDVTAGKLAGTTTQAGSTTANGTAGATTAAPAETAAAAADASAGGGSVG
jgi:hypothetical protein